MQDTPARWVAVHRLHHVHSDERDDPHSPLAGFFWGHMGWMFLKNENLNRLEIYSRFAKDLLREPFYKKLETTLLYLRGRLIHWRMCLAIGITTRLTIVVIIGLWRSLQWVRGSITITMPTHDQLGMDTVGLRSI